MLLWFIRSFSIESFGFRCCIFLLELGQVGPLYGTPNRAQLQMFMASASNTYFEEYQDARGNDMLEHRKTHSQDSKHMELPKKAGSSHPEVVALTWMCRGAMFPNSCPLDFAKLEGRALPERQVMWCPSTRRSQANMGGEHQGP